MPSGWEVYYLVCLSALLALLLPLILTLVSFVISSHRQAVSQNVPDAILNASKKTDKKVLAGLRINTRFFLGANVALVLVTMALILVPCVGAFSPDSGFRELLGIVTLVAFAAFALFYSARKGDLNWLRSFKSGEEK